MTPLPILREIIWDVRPWTRFPILGLQSAKRIIICVITFEVTQVTTVPQRHRWTDRVTDNVGIAIPRFALRATGGKNQPRVPKVGFYRAMHVVLARYCYRKSSVRLSVCLSVCNVAVR